MKEKPLLFTFLVLSLTGLSITWSKTNYSHLLGHHYGLSTAGGLFYRHYVGTNFSWQVSFYPMYMNDPTIASEPSFLFSFGNMEQLFLHFTQLNTSSMKGQLFLWAGGSIQYQKGGSYPNLQHFTPKILQFGLS
ncbi:hypothetical protein [Thermospira aquatica]|uniref:Acyloxyacyl hydrolase n=1 Tax=Thermospira aquatica TaxID=2828656 RepID=A0AAX3BES2_9SPIR|nr:hypothetical protein [Thermospira aquatica]URA10731.1 hypothetical protein KDW03_02710 [Thermospira aquatica]